MGIQTFYLKGITLLVKNLNFAINKSYLSFHLKKSSGSDGRTREHVETSGEETRNVVSGEKVDVLVTGSVGFVPSDVTFLSH